MPNFPADFFPSGWLLATVRDNPLASIVVSILASLLLFALLIRSTQHFIFAASISNINQKSLDSLAREINELRARVERAETDRDVFFREKVELGARVTILEENAITSRGVEERLRAENSEQLKEILDLRAQVRSLEARCAEADAKLVTVKERVVALEAAAAARRPVTITRRRATD